MKLQTSLYVLVAASLLPTLPLANAQNATTDPVGFVTMNITAGTGSAKKISFLSVPLLETAEITGKALGSITGFTSTTISDSDAAWTAGELSIAATPHLIQITSGSAKGAMFLISTSVANTSTTLTINSEDAVNTNLTSIGLAVGDTYKIIPCDTLSSFFGTPSSTGVFGGTSQNSADTIQIIYNGSTKTYFYNTTSNRWTQVTLGSPDASNTPLRPYVGLKYARLSASNLQLTVMGNVPVIEREVPVKNSGNTLLAQYWPVDTTLDSLGIQNISNWTAAASAANADTVQINANGVTKTFFYDGTNWRQVTLGSPIRNTEPLGVGSSVILNQKGSAGGYATYSQPTPYAL